MRRKFVSATMWFLGALGLGFLFVAAGSAPFFQLRSTDGGCDWPRKGCGMYVSCKQ